MPKDFAARGASRPRSRKRTKRRTASPRQRVLFHGPSFSFGAIIGAAIVILAAYAPELLRESSTSASGTPRAPAEEPEPELEFEFEFPSLLRDSEVKAEPEHYAPPDPQARRNRGPFNIQAASFRDRDDAERLRARLLLQDLPARTEAGEVDGQRWHRVVVGPITQRIEADRVMTRLREQDLSAIWIEQP